jgi:hypothetical protein
MIRTALHITMKAEIAFGWITEFSPLPYSLLPGQAGIYRGRAAEVSATAAERGRRDARSPFEYHARYAWQFGREPLGSREICLKRFEILLSEMIFPGEDKPALFHYPACIMLRSPPPLAGATTGLGTAYNDGAQQTAAAWKTHSHRNPCKDSNGDVAAFDVLATYNITAKRRVVSRDLPITGLPPNFVAHARERWTFRSGVARS